MFFTTPTPLHPPIETKSAQSYLPPKDDSQFIQRSLYKDLY